MKEKQGSISIKRGKLYKNFTIKKEISQKSSKSHRRRIQKNKELFTVPYIKIKDKSL